MSADFQWRRLLRYCSFSVHTPIVVPRASRALEPSQSSFRISRNSSFCSPLVTMGPNLSSTASDVACPPRFNMNACTCFASSKPFRSSAGMALSVGAGADGASERARIRARSAADDLGCAPAASPEFIPCPKAAAPLATPPELAFAPPTCRPVVVLTPNAPVHVGVPSDRRAQSRADFSSACTARVATFLASCCRMTWSRPLPAVTNASCSTTLCTFPPHSCASTKSPDVLAAPDVFGAADVSAGADGSGASVGALVVRTTRLATCLTCEKAAMASASVGVAAAAAPSCVAWDPRWEPFFVSILRRLPLRLPALLLLFSSPNTA
eukprot:m.1257299 g.1257299  ORF g.1257299 m.1257299 type:complete len:324 (-) comp24713_c0_seq10:4103-5074(-)